MSVVSVIYPEESSATVFLHTPSKAEEQGKRAEQELCEE
jgi:hypothetical protein